MRSAPVGVRLLCVLAALTLGLAFVQPHGVSAAPGRPTVGNGGITEVCGTVLSYTMVGGVTYITINATFGGSGVQTYSVAPGVTVGADATVVGNLDCLAVSGSTAYAVAGPSSTPYCGTVTAIGTNTITITAFLPSSISSTFTISPSLLPLSPSIVVGSTVCLVSLGGAGGTATSIVLVSGPGPVVSQLTVAKLVRDVTTGGAYSTSISASAGDDVRYQITVTNNGPSTANSVGINDPLQPGQYYVATSCSPPGCSFAGNQYSNTIGTIPVGFSQTVYFDVTIAPRTSNITITNTATAFAAGVPSSMSNSTIITVVTPVAPPPVYPPVTYPFGFPFSGTFQICGVVTSYIPSGSAYGYLIVNGENLTLMPYLVPGGSIVVGGSYCLTLTADASGAITSVVIAPNIPGINYVCGTVSPFNPGYSPFPGYAPYPGYTPYPGSGSYPGYGPYPYGTTPGMYGWGGPVMVGGYPFAVAPGTTFPFTVNYGNPYCFLMNPGFINGSLSVVPTAASPSDEPAGVHHSGASLAV